MMSGLLAAMDGYDSIIEMSQPAATYGVTPISLDEFVHSFAGAARAEVHPGTAADQPVGS
jgi:hypothetical protein